MIFLNYKTSFQMMDDDDDDDELSYLITYNSFRSNKTNLI